MALIGVDEAGKGPVLGPMVTAAVRLPDESVLPVDVDDSKHLSPATRTRLASTLRETPSLTITTHHVTPDQIDTPTANLNTLTVTAHATVIETVATAGDHAIVDASDVNPDRFGHRVTANLTRPLTVTAEHHADETHDITAAASIIAKVERDECLTTLAARHGEIGSGYPSDPTTRSYLREYYETHREFPAFARTSWETCTTIRNTVDQPSLDGF